MKPSSAVVVYEVSWSSVNGPMEGALIDSFSLLSFSLTPAPRAACISPGSAVASLVSLSLSCCVGTGDFQTWDGSLTGGWDCCR